MTPKEKAMQLFNRMIVDFDIDKWQSQQCALVAVDEIISAVAHEISENVDWWVEVKQEIEKL